MRAYSQKIVLYWLCYMAHDIVLGLDLGTSSCKACAVDLTGLLLGRESSEYDTITPHHSWAEQKPDDWLKALVSSVRTLLKRPELNGLRVSAVSLSSAAHIAVLVDEEMTPLMNAILWYDQRSREEVRELLETTGDAIFHITKNAVSPTWTLPQLLWIRRHRAGDWSKTRSILLSKDYAAFFLTGRCVTDPATALSSMLYDPEAGNWSEYLLEIAGLDTEQLPEVISCTSAAGTVRREASADLGIPEGIPVFTGTLDSAAETYCAGALNPGDTLLRVATAGGIHVVLGSPKPHRKLITYPHAVQPFWYSQAGTNSCTSAIQWGSRLCGCSKETGIDSMEALASSIEPGSEGLFFHPYLSGERCPYWDGSLRASFTGASFRHTRAHFARAVYEGAAYSLLDAFSVIDELGAADENLTAVGGGVNSPLLMRILSDVFGKEITALPYADSAYGAALLGLHGIGGTAVLREPVQYADQRSEVFRPEIDRVTRYAEGFRIYRQIQRQLEPVYRSRTTEKHA